jgi:ribonuclease P protein component
MVPPSAPLNDTAVEEDTRAAVSLRLQTLQKRSDFLRAARGPRAAMPGFILQVRHRKPGEADGIRVGFTCSKKVGNAVARSRAKRRLREVARLTLPKHGKPGHDYVLIGRADTTATRTFSDMLTDMERALNKLHRGGA